MSCGATLGISSASVQPPIGGTASPLASLGSRIIAGIIDYIIIGIIAGIIFFVAFAPFFMSSGRMGGMMPGFGWRWLSGMFLIQFLLWLVYFTYFEGTSGQTIGKKVAHIKVVKNDESKCDVGSALIRNILRIIDHLPFIYILGMILIAATNKKQRLGDMLAKTIVVKV